MRWWRRGRPVDLHAVNLAAAQAVQRPYQHPKHVVHPSGRTFINANAVTADKISAGSITGKIIRVP